MTGSDKKRRIPRQRGMASGAVHPLEALCPEAQRQWDLMLKMGPSVRRVIYQRTGAQAAVLDDIEAKVWLALYTRLKNSGPLEERIGRVETYLWTVARNEAKEYLAELATRAECFVGDHTYLLEPQEAHRSAESESLVDLAPAMRVLRDELSDFQLKAFVLAEGYGLKAPVIAELLGGTTKGSVRDALRHARRKLRSERVGLRLGVLAED